jgi:hypothetical protein
MLTEAKVNKVTNLSTAFNSFLRIPAAGFLNINSLNPSTGRPNVISARIHAKCLILNTTNTKTMTMTSIVIELRACVVTSLKSTSLSPHNDFRAGRNNIMSTSRWIETVHKKPLQVLTQLLMESI